MDYRGVVYRRCGLQGNKKKNKNLNPFLLSEVFAHL